MSVEFSQHARVRMAEMGVTTRRVKRVLRHPTTEYRGSLDPKLTGRKARRVVTGDGLAIVLAPDDEIVVTVQPHGRARYEDEP